MTLRRRSAAVVAAVVSVAVIAGSGSMTSAAPSSPVTSAKDPRLAAEFVEGDVIVGFVPGTPAHVRGRALASIGAAASRQLSPLDADAALVRLAGGRTTSAALAALDRNPNVRYAEPNYVVQSAFDSNDTYFTNGSLWGMYGDTSTPANSFGSQAAEAWSAGNIGSSSVYVGVIDEGIDLNHPDLASNVWTNPVDPANGVDDDGNGYVDDVNGWDFDGNNNSVFDGAGDDHGTHVAGTIGGVGGNGAGVAGVNWDVTMISAKFLGSAGGTTANAILAVDYITNLKNRLGLNIVATSNSWGGGGFSQGLLDAINRGGDAGILFVAAAGNSNSNNDAGSYYPANYQCTTTAAGAPRGWDCMITVAAIDSTGAKASFSSYGATTVDLGAPGVGVNSTTPSNSYASYSGTSMATPHVSGAVALCASMSAAMSAQELRTAVLASTAATPSMTGTTVTGGRLDVGSMTGQCESPSTPVTGAPTNLTATALSAMSIRLDWIDGTTAETYHEVQRSTGACTTWVAASTLGANSTSAVIGALQPSTTYCFRVRAGNRFDTGNGLSVTEWTNVASATTDSAPDPYLCSAVPFTWHDAAGGTGLTMSDDSSIRMRLPFTFAFYDEVFDSIDISSNGYVTFGSGATAYSNGAIPTAGVPDGFVAPMWDDLNPGAGGSVITKTFGAAPERTFVISWENVPHYSVAGSAVTFQVAFDEATQSVSFNYLDPVFGSATYDRGASATVGVESPTALYGTQVGFNRTFIGDRTSLRCSTEPTADPSITTTSLPTGFVQNAYQTTIAMEGGTAPYTWTVTSGALPAGLTLSSTAGVVSGFPTTQGVSTATIRVTDAAGRTASATFDVTIELGLYISTSSLPAAGQSLSYSTTLVASSGTTPYRWTSTALPAGLYLTESSGELWGTPTVSGNFTITFSVADSAGNSASRAMSLAISAAPLITTTSLVPAMVSVPVSRTLSSSGGAAPISWAVASGTLPTGLTLSTTGVLSGTPSAAGVFEFTARITDSLGRTDDQLLSMTVDPLFVVTTSALPNGGVGYPYSATLVATGGSGGYTWSVTGTLPAGLSISTTGVISGTPTALGTSTFTVVARDTSGRSSSRSLSIAIVAAPTITTTSLNSVLVNGVFSVTLAATAGAGVRTWSVSSGALPTGATLSSTGVLSGTVATAGTYSFTVLVTDELGRTDDQALTLVVVSPVSITTVSLPGATVGVAYSTTLAATGGSGTYTWTATGVPAGMSLSTDGVLSGTPSTGATSSIAFTATDNGTPVRTSTRSLSLVVSAPLVVTTASLNSVVAGSAFSFTLASTGGSGTKTWSIASGTLPAGATLSTGGVLSGTVATAGSTSFAVRVTDAGGRTDDQDLTLVAVNPVSITTSSLPAATVDAAYSTTLVATGGSGTYTWTATGVPAGLSLSSTGVLSGTPTAAATSSISFTVSDNGTPVRTSTRSLSLVVSTSLVVTTASLNSVVAGSAFSFTLASTGGSGTKTWSIASGSLPAGATLSTGGVLSGTVASAGSSAFTVRVTDAGGRTDDQDLTLVVVSPISITTSSMPEGTVDAVYGATMAATGGSGTYAWSATGLPVGLAIDPSTGAVSGTPTAAGTSVVSVTVTDSGTPVRSATR
ncbi:MAG: hypothetical protein RJB61_1802, partial [Actinomycetota bacterium]